MAGVGGAYSAFAEGSCETRWTVAEPCAGLLMLGADGAVLARPDGADGRHAFDDIVARGRVAEQVSLDAVHLRKSTLIRCFNVHVGTCYIRMYGTTQFKT